MTKVNSYRRLKIGKAAKTAMAALSIGATMVSPTANAAALANQANGPVNNGTQTGSATGTGSTRVRIRGGRMQTRLEGGKMVLTGFQGGFAGGQVQMNGRLNSSGSASEAQNIDVRFASVSIAKLIGLAAPGLRLPLPDSVSVSGSANAGWLGSDLLAAAPTVNGAFDVALAPTIVTDPVLLAKLAQAVGIPQLAELKVNSGRIAGTATDGRVQLSSLTLNGPEFDINATGEIDLARQDLDLSLEVTVAHALAQQSTFYKMKNVLGFLKGSSAKASEEPVRLPTIAVVGPLSAPKVQLGNTQLAAAEKSTAGAAVPPPSVETAKPAEPQAFAAQAKKLLRVASAAPTQKN
jgi:hypothetical protein